MREIFFRGKRIDNGEWTFGYLFDDNMVDSKRKFVGGIEITDYKGNADDRFDITGIGFCEVIPETVGQYTGLTDKNGKKIFEGDICDRKEKFSEIVTYHDGDWTLDRKSKKVMISHVGVVQDIGKAYCPNCGHGDRLEEKSVYYALRMNTEE